MVNKNSGKSAKAALNAAGTGGKKKGKAAIIAAMAAVFMVVFIFSFTLGRYGVPFPEVVKILVSRFFKIDVTWTAQMENAVMNVRFPRIVLASFVGCCLSAAGASYQGVFQNPMASPDILGASNGAAFGAALAILSGAATAGITGSAFIFSMVAVITVFVIAQKAPGYKVMNLVLAGIMISSLFSAGTSYIKLVADPSNQLPAITYWLMGSLSGAKYSDMWMLLPMVAGLAALFLVRWRLNLLSLGDDEAHTLGINTNRLRLIIILASTLITASSVAVSGTIGWVGLVVPHFARKLVGSDYRYLMPASFLCGATFLLIVDDISRNLLAKEIPIGILTAFVGAPFFIYLLCRKDKTLG